MRTITVHRDDVTIEEVSEALRQGLGPRYKVLPGMGMNWNCFGKPQPDHPDMIVIGTGYTRLFRSQVRLSHEAGETILYLSPGGWWGWPRVTNAFWIARKVRQALLTAPGLRRAA
jgi:acetyl esterase/lipase